MLTHYKFVTRHSSGVRIIADGQAINLKLEVTT